jgi:hypothetical protein
MYRAIACVLVALTACTTTTASSAGLVVTDIEVVNHQLVVKQCDLGMHVERETPATTAGLLAADIALGVLAIFAGPVPGAALGPSDEDAELRLSACTWHGAQRPAVRGAAVPPATASAGGAL